MTLSLVDQDGRSAMATAEGQAALAAGDTPCAQRKFAEAGAALEQTMPGLRRPSDKHLARFLAASQYYHGGHYQKALGLCQKIQEKFLPTEVRALFSKFFRDVRERAKDGYALGVRRQLVGYWPKKDFDGILETLQKHPYVMSAGAMAFIRAVISEELKNYRAAALFYADAMRLTPNGFGHVYSAAALPLTLPGKGRLEEAWGYVLHQLELIPHPVIYLVASLLCFHRASAAQEEGRRRTLFEEQLHHFNQGRAAYKELSPAQQAKKELQDLMVLGFEAAALGLIQLGDKHQAHVVCDEAISYAPDAPQPWTMRGIVKDPEAGAVDDFKKAVALGDDSYFSYFFLAQDAMAHDDFRSALSWAQQALQKPKKPHAHITAQLFAWMAICQDRLGADQEEIKQLFRKALEIDPTNEEIKGDYHLVLHPTNSLQAKTRSSWRQNNARALQEIFLQDQASYLTDIDKIRRSDFPMRELQTVGA